MKASTLATVWVGMLLAGAVAAIGVSTPKRIEEDKRIEVETGRNTLEMRQAIERERLATSKQMQQRRFEAEAERQREHIKAEKELERQQLEAAAARQRAYIEAQKELAAERLRQKCKLENRRYCM